MKSDRHGWVSAFRLADRNGKRELRVAWKHWPTAVPDVLLVESQRHTDERGYLVETWNSREMQRFGVDSSFPQDNLSASRCGVLRGLHYQLHAPQGKLVRVVSGRAFDVAVDIRRSSPTFRRWVGVELTADRPQALWIPPGFAHGFLALEEHTVVHYKCSALYASEDSFSIRWDDPEIGIAWPDIPGGSPILSSKDAEAPGLAGASVFL